MNPPTAAYGVGVAGGSTGVGDAVGVSAGVGVAVGVGTTGVAIGAGVAAGGSGVGAGVVTGAGAGVAVAVATGFAGTGIWRGYLRVKALRWMLRSTRVRAALSFGEARYLRTIASSSARSSSVGWVDRNARMAQASWRSSLGRR